MPSWLPNISLGNNSILNEWRTCDQPQFDVTWSNNNIAQMMAGQPYVTNVIPIATSVIIRITRGRMWMCRDVSSAQKRVMTRLRVDMENLSSAIHVMSMAIHPNIVICIKNRDSARKGCQSPIALIMFW